MKKIAQLVVVSLITVTLAGCSLFKKAPTDVVDGAQQLDVVPAQGATVSVDYLGTLADGTVFDTNIEAEAKKAGSGVYSEAKPYVPLTFSLGQNQMIPGFEKAVVGMKKGETKTVTIASADAYGEPNDELLFTTGVVMFTDAGVQPVIGEAYDFGGARGVIKALSGDSVTIDFNHELAGKELTFKITIVDIVPTAGVAPVGIEGEVQ